MEKHRILTSDLNCYLTDGFDERRHLKVANCSTYLRDDDFGFVVLPNLVDTAFDFISNVWNQLHGLSKVVPSPLFCDHFTVDGTRSKVGMFIQIDAEKPFIVSYIKIGFCAIMGDKNLAMLEWVHHTCIYIEIRVDLDDDYLKPAVDE